MMSMRRRGARAAAGAVLVVVLVGSAGCGASSGPSAAAPVDDQPSLPSREPLPSWSPPPPTSFTVVTSGDVLIHPALTEQAQADGGGARDYRRILAGIKGVISDADLAICHLETPLATAEGPFLGYPAFNAPPEVAAALADAGYDECSTASNHTLDRGPAGVRQTLDTLDAAGIRHTGSARSAQEAQEPRILDAPGAKVGHVSFTVGFNGFSEPAATPWLANDLDVRGVLDQARAARRAGADVVIVSMNSGNEFEAEPTVQQRELAQALLADDSVDLVIGHAHVVQPFEQVNGKWVAYGLGNSMARHAEPLGTTEEGVIGRFRFGKGADGRWRVDSAEYVPTLIELGPPIRVVDVSIVTPSERRTLALQRTDTVVLSRGAKIRRPGG